MSWDGPGEDEIEDAYLREMGIDPGDRVEQEDDGDWYDLEDDERIEREGEAGLR
jgi:hypothetical protein